MNNNQSKKSHLFNVNLPIELHTALRIWCFHNGETVAEFARTAVFQRMHLHAIQAFHGDEIDFIKATSSQGGEAPSNTHKGFSSVEEAFTVYNELSRFMPDPRGAKIFTGTLRVKVIEDNRVKHYLAYTPPQFSKAEVIKWRIDYANSQRKDYLDIANSSVVQIPAQGVAIGDFA